MYDNKEFFSYQTDLPQDAGFSIFGIAHLLWLLLIFLSLLYFLRRYKTFQSSKKEQILKVLGTVLLFLIVMRLFNLWVIDALSVYELPLHLCGMAGLLCFLHARTRWDWIGQTIFAACLPGTIAALLFPNWTVYPAFSLLSIQGFLYHAVLLSYCLGMLSGGFCEPRISRIWKPILFLGIIAVPIAWFNQKFHTNYMFLKAPSDGSPLIMLSNLIGKQWYVLGLVVVVILTMCIMYVIYKIKVFAI